MRKTCWEMMPNNGYSNNIFVMANTNTFWHCLADLSAFRWLVQFETNINALDCLANPAEDCGSNTMIQESKSEKNKITVVHSNVVQHDGMHAKFTEKHQHNQTDSFNVHLC